MNENLNSTKAKTNEFDIICPDCSKGQPDNKYDYISSKCLKCEHNWKNWQIVLYQDKPHLFDGLRVLILFFIENPKIIKNESDRILFERIIQKVNDLSGAKLARLVFESEESLDTLYADNMENKPEKYMYIRQLLFDEEKNLIKKELRIQKLEEIMKNAKRRCKTKPLN
jgi:hypothetical protein